MPSAATRRQRLPTTASRRKRGRCHSVKSRSTTASAIPVGNSRSPTQRAVRGGLRPQARPKRPAERGRKAFCTDLARSRSGGSRSAPADSQSPRTVADIAQRDARGGRARAAPPTAAEENERRDGGHHARVHTLPHLLRDAPAKVDTVAQLESMATTAAAKGESRLLLGTLRRALACVVRDNDGAMPRVSAALHKLASALPAGAAAATSRRAAAAVCARARRGAGRAAAGVAAGREAPTLRNCRWCSALRAGRRPTCSSTRRGSGTATPRTSARRRSPRCTRRRWTCCSTGCARRRRAVGDPPLQQGRLPDARAAAPPPRRPPAAEERGAARRARRCHRRSSGTRARARWPTTASSSRGRGRPPRRWRAPRAVVCSKEARADGPTASLGRVCARCPRLVRADAEPQRPAGRGARARPLAPRDHAGGVPPPLPVQRARPRLLARRDPPVPWRSRRRSPAAPRATRCASAAPTATACFGAAPSTPRRCARRWRCASEAAAALLSESIYCA